MSTTTKTKDGAGRPEWAVTPVGLQVAVGGSGLNPAPFRILPHGIEFDARLTEEEYRGLLGALRTMQDAYDACLGSTLRKGVEWFGKDRVEEWLEQLEFPYATAVRALVISQLELAFDEWTGLTGEHLHVLGLAFRGNQELQEKWSRLVLKHQLSPKALKVSIERGEVVTDKDIEATSGQKTGGLGFEWELELAYKQWTRRIGGHDAVLHWSRDARERWLAGVEPITKLAAEVKASLEQETAEVQG